VYVAVLSPWLISLGYSMFLRHFPTDRVPFSVHRQMIAFHARHGDIEAAIEGVESLHERAWELPSHTLNTLLRQVQLTYAKELRSLNSQEAYSRRVVRARKLLMLSLSNANHVTFWFLAQMTDTLDDLTGLQKIAFRLADNDARIYGQSQFAFIYFGFRHIRKCIGSPPDVLMKLFLRVTNQVRFLQQSKTPLYRQTLALCCIASAQFGNSFGLESFSQLFDQCKYRFRPKDIRKICHCIPMTGGIDQKVLPILGNRRIYIAKRQGEVLERALRPWKNGASSLDLQHFNKALGRCEGPQNLSAESHEKMKSPYSLILPSNLANNNAAKKMFSEDGRQPAPRFVKDVIADISKSIRENQDVESALRRFEEEYSGKNP